MRINEFMTAQVGFEAPETQVLEIARKMRESDTGSSGVENDRRTGTSTGRDVVRRLVAAGPGPHVPAARAAARAALPDRSQSIRH